MTKEDNQSFFYIFLFALLSFYIYTNGQIVTYDDYWPGQITSLIRDGRIGALILYYPLVNIFEMDMSFRYVGYVFLSVSVSLYLYELSRALNFNRSKAMIFAVSSIFLISSINYKLFVYKAAFITVGSVFLYSWFSIVCFTRANLETGSRRTLALFCSAFFAAMPLVTYQPLFLMPVLSIGVLMVSDGNRWIASRKSLLELAKYSAMYLFLAASLLLTIYSDFYIDLYRDIQHPRRNGFDFSSFLALDGTRYVEFYVKKLYNRINLSMDIASAILLLSTVLYALLFLVKDSRDRLYLFLLLSVIGLATIINPFIVLNDGLAIRRVVASFFTTFCVLALLSLFLVKMRPETVKSRVLLLVWLLVVTFVSYKAVGIDYRAAVSTLFLSVAIFLAANLFGRFEVPLYAVVMVFCVVVNAQLNIVKIEKVYQMEKVEDKIYADVMFEVLRIKRKTGSEKISVFIETDFNNFRDNAPSYSRLGYFASKNFLPGVEFVDGNSKCRGSKREGFMTIEEIGESSVRVCF